ncbi:MAG: hypothetical protein JNK60_19250, partial [Acidobacteria bacterium]|nr:hypothetical protein [Acidobacteriota bacterium]
MLVPGAFPGVPSYRVPEGLAMPAVGARVAVPFGPKLVTAVVSDLAPPPAPEGVRER